MAYSKELYEKAQSVLEGRRSAAQARAAEMRRVMTKKVPRLAEIEQQMAQSAGKVVSAILAGGNVDAEVERIKTENLALQVELAMLLQENGVNASNFEPQYTCPKCEDTGVHGTKYCDCFLSLLQELSCESLSELSGMKPLSFEDMSLNYYSAQPDARTGISPRARMRDVIAYCRSYAEGFDGTDVSLLLRGPTGVGKTHLSLAIAGEVMARGYSVVYGPVQKLLHRLEKEHFGRAEGNSEDVMIDCDLLILDDVGTEFASPFYTSALYNIINGRMLEEKPTIISTNLNQKELAARYGEQIASRVTGTFQPLVCVGKDIRQLKLKQSLE
ncbi:MAG: ATP-binding protein [Clostridia bacterium]|nr:ATP-binding protein [Clostridia bacterium]